MKNAPKLSKIQSILALLVLTLLSTPSYAQDTLKLNGANHENLKRIGETNVWVDYSDSYLLPSSQNPSLLIDMQTSGFLMLEEKPIALSEYITNVRALTRYRDTLLNIPIQIAGFKGSLMKGVTGRGEAAEIFWLMYFGDESRVYDWKGGYLVSNDEILSEQILSILRSVRWIEGDFFEDYPYAFDTGLDGFTFEKIDIPNAVIIKKYEGADSLNATVFYSVGEEFFTL
ncbi:MAG: hypothetical protein KDC24_09690 [Saprospiraceae bacterium]|nr:hypothetical protein [Saprospiraceae bacterium]